MIGVVSSPALPAPGAAPQRLYDIGARHGTDKAGQRHWPPPLHATGQICMRATHNPGAPAVYEEYFEPLRTTELVLVEIGVLGGASLRMWREYFPRAQIFGIDVDPEAEAHADDRITVLIGSQSDTRFLDAALERTGRPDIVLDDGSHYARDQTTTLLHLWRHVKPGGIMSSRISIPRTCPSTTWAGESPGRPWSS